MTEETWIWGRRPVLEGLRAGRVRRVLIADNVRGAEILDEIRAAARDAGAEVGAADQQTVDRLARGGVSQGVVASVRATEPVRLEDLLLEGGQGLSALLLVMDQIQDPHNVGSLIRSAEAAGVTGIVLTARRAAGITPVVVKTSAGAAYHVPISVVTNLGQTLIRLRESEIWTVALEQDAATTIYDVDLTLPTALIVGGEGSGLRRLTAARADVVAGIPMRGRIGSLNAAVAGAVALFEAARQRATSGPRSG